MTALVVAMLLMLARPAWANSLQISGSAPCPDQAHPDHVVSWAIHNVESRPGATMTITSATARTSEKTYPVEGYDSVVAPGHVTTATTLVPGEVTGTIRLVVRATFADHASATASTDVELLPFCGASPTTTTAPRAATTAPPSTSSATAAPVTAATAPTTSAPAPAQSAVAAAETGNANATLPRTGGASTDWALVGLAVIAFGSALFRLSGKRASAERP
jgi:hypothetical protein